MENELIYWMAIAHLPRWTQERINSLVIDILNNKKMTLRDFFELDNELISDTFNCTKKEINDISNARTILPNLSFQVEELYNQNIEIIPINSKLYPNIMKKNLKVKYSPTVIYTKGDVSILQKKAVAIVGSRNADEKALSFTDNIAKKIAEKNKVVVSGFAKGVDKQALDSCIKYNGNSIIVLPQGILTFNSGFRKYKEEIEQSKVVVLSTYPIYASWSTGLAMGRNRYIYGLAEEIYIAQTNSSGGTWTGAVDGIRKHRDVYIYYPMDDIKSSAYKLIQKGAIPVDFNGQKINIAKTSNFVQLSMFN